MDLVPLAHNDLAVAAVAGLLQNDKILKQIPSPFLNINAQMCQSLRG